MLGLVVDCFGWCCVLICFVLVVGFLCLNLVINGLDGLFNIVFRVAFVAGLWVCCIAISCGFCCRCFYFVCVLICCAVGLLYLI